jgi:hypothetical protein
MENQNLILIFTHGSIVLIAGSIFGFFLLYKAFKGNEYFFTGTILLPKWFLILFGTLLQIPLIVYIIVWIYGAKLKLPFLG